MTYDQSHHRPREEWGTWCKHGRQLSEPDPVDADREHPRYRYVEPWGCPDAECTREIHDRECEVLAVAYHAELEREAFDLQASSTPYSAVASNPGEEGFLL